ncbi:MAG: hypothetical protein ACFCUE_12980 [Candidatus Bathyarchaeia archaeon]
MPLLYARKEVFQWLMQGIKTIDIRKGKPLNGEFAVFQCGPQVLRLRIVGVESGLLVDLVRVDNFLRVIPTAGGLEAALAYVQGLYPGYGGVFTAYFLEGCGR